MGGLGEDGKPISGDFDPVPESALKRASEAFSQRDIGPIARLVSDSLLDHSDPAESHVLRFAGGGCSIVLRVGSEMFGTSLGGSLDGSGASTAMLQLEGSELALVTGVEDGSFQFDPVSHGIVRLCFALSEGSTLRTDWFQV